MLNQNNKQEEELNKAFVVGYLKEKNIEFTTDKKGKPLARGTLVIQVKNQYGMGEVSCNVLQYRDKKDGTPNSLYKALVTISQQYKSIAEMGEKSDYIKIEGKLSDNTYYSQNKNDFVSKTGISATFINRIDPSKEPSCAKACVKGTITSIEAQDSDGNLPVEICSIGYSGIGLLIKGKVKKELATIFLNKYKVGCTTTLNFDIVNSVEVEKIQKEVGFGEDLGEKITHIHTDFIIFGGTPADFTKNRTEEVKKALALREANLESKKEKSLSQSELGVGFSNDIPTGAGAFDGTAFSGQSANFGSFSPESFGGGNNAFDTTNAGGFGVA